MVVQQSRGALSQLVPIAVSRAAGSCTWCSSLAHCRLRRSSWFASGPCAAEAHGAPAGLARHCQSVSTQARGKATVVRHMKPKEYTLAIKDEIKWLVEKGGKWQEQLDALQLQLAILAGAVFPAAW